MYVYCIIIESTIIFFSISIENPAEFPLIFQYQVIDSTNFHNLQIKISMFSHYLELPYLY
jgi:hypothetical protein